MNAPAVLRGIKYVNERSEDPNFPNEPLWLVNFERDGGALFAKGRAECILEVVGFDPDRRVASIVTLKLSRFGQALPIWQSKISNLMLSGVPELVWLEGSIE